MIPEMIKETNNSGVPWKINRMWKKIEAKF